MQFLKVYILWSLLLHFLPHSQWNHSWKIVSFPSNYHQMPILDIFLFPGREICRQNHIKDIFIFFLFMNSFYCNPKFISSQNMVRTWYILYMHIFYSAYVHFQFHFLYQKLKRKKIFITHWKHAHSTQLYSIFFPCDHVVRDIWKKGQIFFVISLTNLFSLGIVEMSSRVMTWACKARKLIIAA